MKTTAAIALVLAGVAACGGSDPVASTHDAGSPCSGEAVPGACIVAGVPPEACPTGFTAQDPRSCAPVLPSDACAPGTMAIPGETSCRDVEACPTAKYGEAPVDDMTEFVDASYTGGNSDGSGQRPWTSIQSAIDAAAPNGVIAIADGTYAENLSTAGKSVRLWGRCPRAVTVKGTLTSAPAVQLTEGGAPELHDVAVTGPFVGVYVSGSKGVIVDRVWVHDTGYYAIVGAAQFGATSYTVSRSLVERATGLGVGADQIGATVDQSVVRETIQGTDAAGNGIFAQRGATLAVTRSLILATYNEGVRVVGATATVEATAIIDIRPDPTVGRGGIGIGGFTAPGAGRPSVTVRGAFIQQHSDEGILCEGGDLDVESTVVRDPRGLPTSGVGIAIVDGAAGSVHAVSLERCGEGALVVRGSQATVDQLAVHDGMGFGAVAYKMASLDLRDSTFDTPAVAGVYVFGSTGTLDDVLVRNVQPDPMTGQYGDGVVVNADVGSPGYASVTHVRVEGSARAGMSAFGSNVDVGDAALECNPIQLDVEDSAGSAGSFTENAAVTCGCGADSQTCRAESSMLAPPSINGL